MYWHKFAHYAWAAVMNSPRAKLLMSADWSHFMPVNFSFKILSKVVFVVFSQGFVAFSKSYYCDNQSGTFFKFHIYIYIYIYIYIIYIYIHIQFTCKFHLIYLNIYDIYTYDVDVYYICTSDTYMRYIIYIYTRNANFKCVRTNIHE